MFCALIWGKRAKTQISRAMDWKTSSAMARRSVRRFFRIREFEVAHRGAAQARKSAIEEECVETGESQRRVGQRPEEERDYSIQPPPSTRSPSYNTAAWPGVTARCGSSKRISTRVGSAVGKKRRVAPRRACCGSSLARAAGRIGRGDRNPVHVLGGERARAANRRCGRRSRAATPARSRSRTAAHPQRRAARAAGRR